MVASDNQLAAGDLGRTEAFYAGQAGLEKLTSDLGALFVTTPTPTGDQVRALLASPPLLPNTEFVKPDGSAGYEITFPSTTGDPATGDPITTELTVASRTVRRAHRAGDVLHADGDGPERRGGRGEPGAAGSRR